MNLHKVERRHHLRFSALHFKSVHVKKMHIHSPWSEVALSFLNMSLDAQ